MQDHYINENLLSEFKLFLAADEKSSKTVEKYLRDLKKFVEYLNERPVTKQIAIDYKQKIIGENYAPRSINSMLASINSFFTWQEWYECRVKPLKLQREVFRAEERELTKVEYFRLCEAASRKHNERLRLLMETICVTGIRVSELESITVEAVKAGEAVVSCKGKTRAVFIMKALKKKLMQYVKEHQIQSGPIFITKTGKSLNRSNIWSEMKALCVEANVNPGKVFPHNLRHLFAREFYSIERDIAKLADILGHSSINTTRIYITSTGEEHRRCLERLRLIS